MDKHPVFKAAHESYLAAIMDSGKSGTRTQQVKASPLTDEMFQAALAHPLLRTDTPAGLQRRVQFLLHMFHGIRGGKTVYDLRRGEVTVMEDPATGRRGVQFKEATGVAKTVTAEALLRKAGSSSQCHHVEPCVINEYWSELLWFYKSKLPPASDTVLKKVMGEQSFNEVPPNNRQAYAPLFMQLPTKRQDEPWPSNISHWYSAGQRRGEGMLGCVVQQVCWECGFEGEFTNTSGRVTLCNNLSSSMLPDSVSMSYTGHKQVNSFRAYSVRNCTGAELTGSGIITKALGRDATLAGGRQLRGCDTSIPAPASRTGCGRPSPAALPPPVLQSEGAAPPSVRKVLLHDMTQAGGRQPVACDTYTPAPTSRPVACGLSPSLHGRSAPSPSSSCLPVKRPREALAPVPFRGQSYGAAKYHPSTPHDAPGQLTRVPRTSSTCSELSVADVSGVCGWSPAEVREFLEETEVLKHEETSHVSAFLDGLMASGLGDHGVFYIPPSRLRGIRNMR